VISSWIETLQTVVGLVLSVTPVMGVRGLVAVRTGDVGTLARQVAVGGILLVFGVGLYRRWDTIG
jgi:hypothetical protein